MVIAHLESTAGTTVPSKPRLRIVVTLGIPIASALGTRGAGPRERKATHETAEAEDRAGKPKRQSKMEVVTIGGKTRQEEAWWAMGVGPVKWTRGEPGAAILEVNELRSASFVWPPWILSQPQSATANPDTTVKLTVEATGDQPLAYAWLKNGVNLVNGGNISGATTTNLTLANVQASDAGGYTVVVTNAYGSVTSQVAVLTLQTPQASPWLWARRVASTANPDGELAIGLAMDGTRNLYVTGWFDGTNDLGGISLTNRTGGGQDIFVAKYDSDGDVQWARRAGGSTADRDAGRGIGVDGAGNVYVTGGFYGAADFGGFSLTAPQDQSFFLAKYNSNGAVQWVRQADNSGSTWPGCYGTGLAVDAAGNSYAVGYFDGETVSFGSTTLTNAGTYNVFLVKYNSAGVVQWARCLSSPESSYATSVAVDNGGNVYVPGEFHVSLSIGNANFNSSGGQDGLLAKFNATGTLQWAQSITGNSDARAIGVAVDASGGVYAVGGFGNGSGDTVSFAPSMTLTNEGGGRPGSGIGDGFLVKYDAGGVPQWARRVGGPGLDAFTGVSVDPQGGVYAVGGVDGVAVPDGFKVVVTKYDGNGVGQGTHMSAGTNGTMAFAGPLVDAVGGCYLAGWYQGTALFGTNTLASAGTWNYFLAKLAVGASQLQFAPGSAVSDGWFQTLLTGPANATAILQSSGNLTNWTPVATNTLPVGGLPVSWPMGTNRQQFFRARLAQ